MEYFLPYEKRSSEGASTDGKFAGMSVLNVKRFERKVTFHSLFISALVYTAAFSIHSEHNLYMYIYI